MFFSRTAADLDASAGDRVDIVFSPQINEFRGRRSVQLVLADLRTRDNNELCRRLLTAAYVRPDEVEEYIPIRRDFVELWRQLCRLGGQTQFPLTALAEQLGGEPVRTCICLAVMNELGLAHIRLENETLFVTQNPNSAKVDLEGSLLLRQLRGEAQ